MTTQTFTVLVHDAVEGGYWAEVAELPGCLSQGDTLEEVRANIQEALEACIDAYREDGVPVPFERVQKWELSLAV